MKKNKVLEYSRYVEKSGEELIVTDHRKPVLNVLPLNKKLRAVDVFGDLMEKVQYFEDINTPTSDEWENI